MDELALGKTMINLQKVRQRVKDHIGQIVMGQNILDCPESIREVGLAPCLK